MNLAKVNKNDEFYTRLIDIATTLSNYREYFCDKKVFLNCDDPQYSNFWKYFAANFDELRLKKLTSTHYDLNEATYKLEIFRNDDDIVLSSLSKYVDNTVSSNRIIKSPLKGTGDFRSQECVDILAECDIVVTNPPFSLFREFFNLLIEHKCDYIIVAPQSAATYKEVFPYIIDKQAFINTNGPKEFILPDETTKKFGNIIWLSSFHIQNENKTITFSNEYSKEKYPKLINFDAIEVHKVSDIPYDYYDLMAVPTNFLRYYDENQFELIGTDGYNGKYGRDWLGMAKVGDEWIKTYRKQGGTGHYTANMTTAAYYDNEGNAKKPYCRLFIKRKRSE